MRIELLGTGGFYPNERRHTACILLPELGLMFDAGTGAFRVKPRLKTRSLDVFLTHAHLDHIVGLTFLLPLFLEGSLTSCRIHATSKTIDAVRTHLFAERIFPIEPAFEYRELTDEVAVSGNGILRHIPLKHPGGSQGYRVDWPDHSMAYITDTVADGSYAEFVRGVDVLIHECYFPDTKADFAKETGHSHTTPVARLAADYGVGRLVFVHVDPQSSGDDPVGLPTAREIFPNTELAFDEMTIDF